jgi:Fe2+ or Zn2+ uptake regulation protein
VDNVIALLKSKNIRPTTHRVSVARFVLNATSHPAADEVLVAVRRACPTISRATVYNALELLVKGGLLRRRLLKPGAEVFDPLMAPHHHFIDEKTGAIFDLPLGACTIHPTAALRDYDIKEYHVVLRGRRRKT